LQTRWITTLTAAVVTLAVLGSVSTASSAAQPAPLVTVVMSKAGPTIIGPQTWASGPARVAVRSHVPDEETALLHFRAGYSYARFITDGAKANGHTAAAQKALLRIFANTIFDGGVDLFSGQSADFTVTVRPGTYYLGEMTRRPQLTAIHVAGNTVATTTNATAVVSTTDSGYSIKAALPAHGTITIRNTGNRPHRLNLIPVKAGTTRAQLGAYLRTTGARDNAPPPPFALNGPQLGTADISPQQQMQLTFSLPAGNYALIDFDHDMKSGRPEALEGMYSIATLR
jgi:hypothetical protein